MACREPTGNYDRPIEVLYVFDNEMQYRLIHAPHAHIVVMPSDSRPLLTWDFHRRKINAIRSIIIIIIKLLLLSSSL